MTQIDWTKTKFRASSWGNLLSEPVTKADKEAGKLSLTCQKELLKIYLKEKYSSPIQKQNSQIGSENITNELKPS